MGLFLAVVLGLPAAYGIGKFLIQFMRNLNADHTRVRQPWEDAY